MQPSEIFQLLEHLDISLTFGGVRTILLKSVPIFQYWCISRRMYSSKPERDSQHKSISIIHIPALQAPPRTEDWLPMRWVQTGNTIVKMAKENNIVISSKLKV
jgi:hypothetical protein